MSVIDVFPYCDEVDLATIRLQYLDSIVDQFVIGEFDTSFSGKKKEYTFPQVLDKLPPYLRSKIHYVTLKQPFPSSNSFENDDYQKNTFISSINPNLAKDDFVLVGDCDEFPSIDAIGLAQKKISQGFQLCHLAQENFLGFLNLREITGCILSFTGEYKWVLRQKWLGTVMTTSGIIRNEQFSGLRHPKWKQSGARISRGGWHFSGCNGHGLSFEERFRTKYKFTAHQEFNKESVLANAYTAIRECRDPLERTFSRRIFPGKIAPRFKLIDVRKELPFSFIEDWNLFKHLIFFRD